MKQTLHTGKIIITNNKKNILNGGILIEDSRIKEISKINDFGDLKKYHVIHHENSLICPGFINLHTHLSYSSMKPISGKDGLFLWIDTLLKKTKKWSPDDYKKSIKTGIQELLSSGTIAIVENTPNLHGVKELNKSPLKTLIGIEVFGSDENLANNLFEQYLKILKFNQKKYNNLDFTFSPHAPYNVSKSLWKLLKSWSNKNDIPLLTHLEESKDEELWWTKKTGTATKLWTNVGSLDIKLKHWEKYNSGIDFLSQNNLITKDLIGTHLCEATLSELKLLASQQTKLVHCPRSNFHLKNKIPNLKIWDDFNIQWGLGTDSSASNYDLDLINEARFMIKKQLELYNNKISAKKAFEKITIDPAKILNLKGFGKLRKGSSASFLVYTTDFEKFHKDPYTFLIDYCHNSKDLNEVWVKGKKVYKKNALCTIQ